MIKDRLDELKVRRAGRGAEDGHIVQVYTECPILERFFIELTEVYDTLAGLFKDIEELKRDHAIILTSPYEDKNTEEKVDQLMQEVKTKSKKVRTKLKEFEEEAKRLEKETPELAIYRIYKMQHSAVLHWFTQAMVSYNKVQIDFRDACKSRIKHHLKITGRLTTDDEVEEMLESGNSAVFSQGIVIETQKARQTLADIEARHEDITKLEKSIRELHEMFVDLALLVESQGEMINNIQKNVTATVDFTGKGKEDIIRTRELQTRLRKTRCWLIAIVLVVIVIIGLTIYFSF